MRTVIAMRRKPFEITTLRIVKRAIAIWALFYLSLLCAATDLAAQTAGPERDVLSVTGRVMPDGFAGHLSALRDPSRQMDLGAVMTADSWQALATGGADFGYSRDVVWLRFDMRNDTGAEGAARDEWRLHVRENFFQLFEVWKVAADGTAELLEKLDERSLFSARKVPYPELVAAFELPPGETAEIYIRYWSGGSSQISFSLHDADAFGVIAASRTARNFVFYGMMILLIVAAVVSFAVTGIFVFAAYAFYAGFGLLFIMHADGNGFQYLWPNAPLFNGFATIVLGTGLIVSGANFARHFLQTSVYHPILEKLLIGAIIAPLLCLLATTVIDHQIIKKYLVLLSTCAILLFAASGFVAARTRFREVKFYVIAWAGALLSSLLMTARHWFGIEISEEVQFNSMRVVFVVDAALMGFAIVDRINVLKKNSKEALEASLGEARRSLELSQRLQELEQQYALAGELAVSQERRLADTVHDLRQPLHALRLNVQALMRGDAGPGATDVEETFRYLEDLVNRELASRTRAGALAEAPGGPEADPKVTPLGAVLEAVRDMFAADAAAKGLRLKVVPSGKATRLPPLDVMRIAANLVSNAVKYAGAGKVLVGVRRVGGQLRLEVHDQGPGMTPDAFREAVAREVRLSPEAGVEGAGLGLAIVADLASRHGLEFGLVAARRDGTGVFVTLPEAADSPAAVRMG
jgi:signal transduction histidine kinase